MTIRFEFLDCIEVGNTLGEGVVWRESDQTVWWTDIKAAKLYTMSWPGREVRVFALPERLGSFGLVSGNDDWLVCAFETGFALYQPETAEIRWLSRPSELQAAHVRMNDGKVAPDGGFWAGSMLDGDGALDVDTGFYRQSGTADVRLMIPRIGIPNGLAWSPSGEAFYYSDTVSGTIYAARMKADSSGAIEAAPFAQLEPGTPDGAAIDDLGRYWVALWDAGKVAVFSSDGGLIETFPLPVPRPTCIAFGGPGRSLAFVTSANIGLDTAALERAPLSGGLLIYQTDACGLPANRFVP